MFEDEVDVTKIAAQERVSRQTVCNVVLGEQILKLLNSKMRLEKPLRTEDLLVRLAVAVDRLISKVQTLWEMKPELKGPQFCVYCGEKLVYSERRDVRGRIRAMFRCEHCRKDYPLFKKIKKNNRQPEVV